MPGIGLTKEVMKKMVWTISELIKMAVSSVDQLGDEKVRIV